MCECVCVCVLLLDHGFSLFEASNGLLLVRLHQVSHLIHRFRTRIIEVVLTFLHFPPSPALTNVLDKSKKYSKCDIHPDTGEGKKNLPTISGKVKWIASVSVT